MKEIHYALLPNNEAVYKRQPLPTTPHQCGSVVKESQCPQHLSSVVVY